METPPKLPSPLNTEPKTKLNEGEVFGREERNEKKNEEKNKTSNNDTPGGTRTHNLVIRSHTRCHCATGADQDRATESTGQ